MPDELIDAAKKGDAKKISNLLRFGAIVARYP